MGEVLFFPSIHTSLCPIGAACPTCAASHAIRSIERCTETFNTFSSAAREVSITFEDLANTLRDLGRIGLPGSNLIGGSWHFGGR